MSKVVAPELEERVMGELQSPLALSSTISSDTEDESYASLLSSRSPLLLTDAASPSVPMSPPKRKKRKRRRNAFFRWMRPLAAVFRMKCSCFAASDDRSRNGKHVAPAGQPGTQLEIVEDGGGSDGRSSEERRLSLEELFKLEASDHPEPKSEALASHVALETAKAADSTSSEEGALAVPEGGYAAPDKQIEELPMEIVVGRPAIGGGTDLTTTGSKGKHGRDGVDELLLFYRRPILLGRKCRVQHQEDSAICD